jgi:PadR family transcriptional regulator PadR
VFFGQKTKGEAQGLREKKEGPGRQSLAVDNLLHMGVECLHLLTTSRERRNPYQCRVELLQGTLDMLIPQTLQWGPQHGYGISQAIRIKSGEILQVETGSLYPALHRLERQGWVRSEWKLMESNQRAKYYRITSTGKKQLASDHGRWQQMVEAIGAIMSGELESGEP